MDRPRPLAYTVHTKTDPALRRSSTRATPLERATVARFGTTPMTEQQHEPDLIVVEDWERPAGKAETINVFVNRVLAERDWFAGDTLTIIGEHGAPVLAKGEARVEGDLVRLDDATGRTLLLLVRRLLSWGFGRVTFEAGVDGVMRLVEVQLHLRPALSSQDVQTFLRGLKAEVLPQIKASYGDWWLPGRKYFRIRTDRAGKLESGCLTLSI